MLEQPLDVFSVLVGVLMQKVHQLVILVPDLSEFVNQFFFSFLFHLLVLLKLNFF